MKTYLFSRLTALAVAIAGTLGAMLPTAHAQTTLFGLSFFDNQLISIDTTTGAGTIVGTGLGVNALGYGIAYRGAQLYTYNSVLDRIQQIDTTSGLIASTIDIGVGNLTGEGDLTFRSDGIGFLSTVFKNGSSTPTNDLYTFNIATNSSTHIGTTGDVSINGLAFIGGTLYGVSKDAQPSLYTINQTNGNLSLVGSLGVDMNSPFLGLSARSGGGLYTSVDDRLYTLDVATGTATQVNNDPYTDIGFSSVSGLAQARSPLTPVPEPGTYGMMGVACLLAVVAARRKLAGLGAIANEV
ncbi:MAG: PEP-CTERM sorting domain-containing protein [Opitutaceae bacterium]